MVEAKLWMSNGDAEPQEIALDGELFGGEVNKDLLYRTVRMQMMNRRQGTSSTKTRGEVQGGGRKPWRQKGTGRARAGSRRSPIWVGGGTVFGPKPRTYHLKLTKKMKRGALLSALADRAALSRVIVLDKIAWEAPKTKQAVSLLERLGIDSTALMIVGTTEWTRAVQKSFSNVPRVKCLGCRGLNVYDILRHDYLVMTQGALEELKERF